MLIQSNSDLMNIERLFTSLEGVDLSKVSLDTIVDRISRVEDSITSSGVDNAEELLQRLERFTDIAEKHFSPEKDEGAVRSYVGVYGN